MRFLRIGQISQVKTSSLIESNALSLFRLWDLNYFFKSYHHFFKSAVLWVCDITIFSNEYHDYCKSSYHFLSRR